MSPTARHAGLLAITLTCCGFAVAAARSRAHIYLSASHGRDQPAGAAGQGEDPQLPLQTLRAGQLAARAAAGRPGVEHVTVHAAAGTYAPLELSKLDSDVLYQGSPAASISTGVLLPSTGFEATPSSDPVRSRVGVAVRSSTRRVDIGALGITATELLSSVGPEGIQLSCAGVTQNLASWPSNGSWAHPGDVVSSNGFVYPTDVPLPASGNIMGLLLAGKFIICNAKFIIFKCKIHHF